MIIFFVLAALMAALLLVPPLASLLDPRLGAEATDATETDGYAKRVYAAQLRELEQEMARHLLTPEQVQGTRAEIARRLLRHEAESGAGALTAPIAPPLTRKIGFATMALMPLAALGLYWALGRPDLAVLGPTTKPSQGSSEMAAPPPPVPAEVQAALSKLEEGLRSNPDDLFGWSLLAQTYAATGRHAEAAQAWMQAMRLAPDRPDILIGLAEATIRLEGGQVSAMAEGWLQRVLQVDAKDVRARYFLALAASQRGDDATALKEWTALLSDSPADAPWLDSLRQAIAAASGRLGVPVPPSVAGGAVAPALSDEAMQAAAGLAPEEQAQMIEMMVGRLENRLRERPDDPDGWLRLAGARERQGKLEQARDAAREAARRAPGHVEAWLSLSRLLAPSEQAATASPEFINAMTKVLDLAPNNPQALYYLGQEAANRGDAARARLYWQRLLPLLPLDAPERQELTRRLEALP
jgi:cytochrome c-type biogenesis protein CcmH